MSLEDGLNKHLNIVLPYQTYEGVIPLNAPAIRKDRRVWAGGNIVLAQRVNALESKDPERMNAMLAKTNSISMKKLQLTMMPNLMSSFVFILFLGWMRARYFSMIVALPVMMPVPAWRMPPFIITATLGWFGWYLVTAFAASFIVRDLLNIEI